MANGQDKTHCTAGRCARSAPLNDDDFTRLLVQRESPTVVPQSFVVDVATKNVTQPTKNTHPTSEMTAAIKRT
ncbi:MAG: hypothetical protein ABIW79_01050 [Gemmatimonas sp.]